MAELCEKSAKVGVRHFPVIRRFPMMYGRTGSFDSEGLEILTTTETMALYIFCGGGGHEEHYCFKKKNQNMFKLTNPDAVHPWETSRPPGRQGTRNTAEIVE